MVFYEREISVSSDPGWREQSKAIIVVKNFLSKWTWDHHQLLDQSSKHKCKLLKLYRYFYTQTTITVKKKFFHSKSGLQYLQRMIQFYLWDHSITTKFTFFSSVFQYLLIYCQPSYIVHNLVITIYIYILEHQSHSLLFV